ncbi:molybdate ABC transporter substrate-binding protein [Porticoccaceae bacterium LTM1]|nr:molybdate ABC transporter substrate-binding protein [Porticoccaceae bacterium LTM1]
MQHWRWLVFLFTFSSLTHAEQIRVAVASNFAPVAEQLSARFELHSGHKVILAFGSTGKHYAQIANGAPFDLFLAADSRRPELLEKEGRAIKGGRASYAIGRLVLWSADSSLVDSNGEVLKQGNFERLAIANPRLAPYGQAAQELLESLGVRESSQSKLVRGENISQTLQFVRSGNAQLGLISLSQLKSLQPKGSWWLPPSDSYTAIDQQMVQLTDKPEATAFWVYIKSEEAQKIIAEYGYDLPEPTQ